MDNMTLFLTHCLEVYRNEKQLTGRQVMALFKQYGVLDYIVECYEALHVTGPEYIVEDIDQFILARQ